MGGAKADAGDRGERTGTQLVIVEAIGKLERRSCVCLCCFEPFAVANTPSEPLMDPRLKCRIVCRVVERLALEANVALDVAEQHENLSAPPTCRLAGQQVLRKCARPSRLTCVE